MNVKQLIEELSKYDPNAKISLNVSDPKDSAYTDDVKVTRRDGEVHIDGWVATDNENAFAPWREG